VNPGAPFFISHAHNDHLGSLKSRGRGFLTPETRDIISSRNGSPPVNSEPLRYGEEVELDGLEVISHNAGHMLGSAQYEVRSPEGAVLYTGDINCMDMLTTKAAEAVPCDVLVLETTYGNPLYAFPDPLETYMEMVKWTLKEVRRGVTPVFKVYSAGKAQEVVKALNRFTSIPVVTQSTVARVNRAYEKNGVDLEYVDAASEEGRELLSNGQCAFVTSSRSATAALERFSLAVATGWAVRFQMRSADVAFPLSGHADFRQLLGYVERVRPREVITVHGFKDDFAEYLSRKLGMRARPIVPMAQKPLGEFLKQA
jgi:putative mRNA 3-end processing factor